MRLGRYQQAAEAFARSMGRNPEDTRNRNHWLMARLALGEKNGVARDAGRIAEMRDPTDLVLRALRALAETGTAVEFVEELQDMGGEVTFAVTETAVCFADLGRFEEAIQILQAYCREVPKEPMAWYYLAYYQQQAGKTVASKKSLSQAATQTWQFAFPSRVEAQPVLEYAIACNAEDGLAHLLSGHLAAALWRTDKAVASWARAVALEPRLGEGWRLLGYHAWVKDKDLIRAEDYYRKANAARPVDQIVIRDLARILTEQDRRAEAIRLVEASNREQSPRHDISLWLAQAYIAEDRLDDCIAFLSQVQIKNPEGSSEPRDIWVQALMARGRQHYETGHLELALADFGVALTYPANLEVGQRYRRTDAETCYWLGKARWALGREAGAREAWQAGASQITSDDPPAPSIRVTAVQDEHVRLCASALDDLSEPERP
jgi:tetratricopeptide (TPR) repeat protein